jgi:hypothetical protein
MLNAQDPSQRATWPDKKDTDMKAKIWVLCTVLTDENAPALPAVFASETEAWAKYGEVIRAEWDSMMDPNGDALFFFFCSSNCWMPSERLDTFLRS